VSRSFAPYVPAMIYMRLEVASQPGMWRMAAERTAPELAAASTTVGPLAAIGCGTSWFVAQTIAPMRETAGYGPTELHQLLAVRRAGRPAKEVVAVAGTPVALAADALSVLGHADEMSVVQTRCATSVVAATRVALGEDVEPLAPSVVLDHSESGPPS